MKEPGVKEIRQSSRLKGAPQPYYGSTHLPRKQVIEGASKDADPKGNFLADLEFDDDLLNFAGCLIAEESANPHETPKTYAQAMRGPNAEEWKESMNREIQAHLVSGTWELVPRPTADDQNVIMRGLWRLRVKTQHGKVTSLKSRYCADGSRVKDLPENVYAPTAAVTSINMMLLISALWGIPLKSGDIPSAYVQAPMPANRSYYVTHPPGFISKEYPEHVLKLNKALYGVPCAGHQWNLTYTKFLLELGFRQCDSDPCLFVLRAGKHMMLFLLVVDNDLNLCTSPRLEAKVTSALTERFRYISDGICNWFLGMNITQNYSGVFISQKDYVASLVKEYEKIYSRKHDTPGDPGETLDDASSEKPDFRYQKLVGSLLWAVKTRPDIAFAVTQCCRFASNFGDTHVKAALRIIGYLRKYPNYGLKFNVIPSWTPTTPLNMIVYCDASWANEVQTRRSYYGYLVFIESSLIASRCKLTPGVAHSSCESEYVALDDAAREVVYIIQLVKELGLEVKLPVPLYCDSKGARHWATNRMVNQRSKHIALRYHYIRELVAAGTIDIQSVDTEWNCADIHTKHLGPNLFSRHRSSVVHEE